MPSKLTLTKEYQAWRAMKKRCLLKTNRSFPQYGGRGISICKRWMSFKLFLKDMGKAPKGRSLDRINVNKGYSKKNCRWATLLQQNRNKTSSIFVSYKGKKYAAKKFSKIKNVKYTTLLKRHHAGFVDKKLITG